RGLAGVGVAVLVFVRAVDGRLAVVDVDPQAGAVGAHHPQPIGHRVEVDGGADAGLERLRHLALHRGLAGFGIDGEDRAVAGNAVKHAVGRRTSMPRSGPAPLTSTFEATLRVAGSMVTIDLPSTRPMIQPAA